MKWTSNTLVEKLPQFPNSFIPRIEKKTKGRLLKAYATRREVDFLHHTYLVHIFVIYIPRGCKVFIYSHPRGRRVSSVQDEEVGQTRTEKINHNSRSRKTLALCLQKKRKFHKTSGWKLKGIGEYKISDVKCWCKFSTWNIHTHTHKHRDIFVFQRPQYEMLYFYCKVMV